MESTRIEVYGLRVSRTVLSRLLAMALMALVTQPATSLAAKKPKKSSASKEEDALKKEVDHLKKIKSKLQTENSIAAEELKKELRATKQEKERLEARVSLIKAKLSLELAERKAKVERMRMEEQELHREKALSAARRKGKLEKDLAKLREEKERLDVEVSLIQSRHKKQLTEYKISEITWKERINRIKSEIAEKEKQTERRNYADKQPVYLKNPLLSGGTLVISDRRIPLNGPITLRTANYIDSRINYYNNASTKHPIFIVIDTSPGGSVMAGFKILKAMESSAAPVYVVVKSYAASMAATIATLAQKSFAYPNAIILHHQLRGMSFGNLTMQKERVKEIEEWWRRLAGPVAKKMGLSREGFVKAMYKNASTGDWQEFGDAARKLRWVDHVVERIQETALVKNPDGLRHSPRIPISGKEHRMVSGLIDPKKDMEGQWYQPLPRLNPIDMYYLYNPDRYYRVE